jgi:hypothetical protein
MVYGLEKAEDTSGRHSTPKTSTQLAISEPSKFSEMSHKMLSSDSQDRKQKVLATGFQSTFSQSDNKVITFQSIARILHPLCLSLAPTPGSVNHCNQKPLLPLKWTNFQQISTY